MADIVYKATGGLNEDTDLATMDQIVEGANVWMPQGRLEQRPGCRRVSGFRRVSAGNVAHIITHDVSTGVITETGNVGGLEEGDYIYFVFPTYTSNILRTVNGFWFNVTPFNSNAVSAKLEYWEGSDWSWIPMSESIIASSASQFNTVSYLFSDDGSASSNEHFFSAPAPDNWGFTSITTSAGVTRSGVAIRLTLQNAGMAAPASLSAGTVISNFFIDCGYLSSYPDRLRLISGLARFDLVSGRYYYMGLSDTLPNPLHMFIVSRSPYGFAGLHSTVAHGMEYPFLIEPYENSISTLAPVPQADRAYVTVHGKVLEINPSRQRQVAGSTTPGWLLDADVEDNEAIVGPGAIADRETLSQLSSFPSGDVIVFFQNRLWICAKHRVRWSLAAPAHKVWPADAFADLMENDNSEIVAAAPLGEHLVVYKRDSIWIMALQGLDDFGVAQYTPVQVVRGIGCVAPSSLQTVRGRHIFLAEDGVYAFDGTPNIRKVTIGRTGDRLAKTIGQINPSLRYRSAGVVWQSRSCYLLSLASGRSNTNARTLVWQYDRDIWWLWDGFNAHVWMLDEGSNDEEEIYFGDQYGRICRFGTGETDFGFDTLPYVKYPPIGRDDGSRKILHDVEVLTSNESAPTDIAIAVNDGTEKWSTYNNSSSAEAKYGTATFGTARFSGDRRRFTKRDWAEAGDTFNVVASKTQDHTGEIWQVNNIRVGVTPIGRR